MFNTPWYAKTRGLPLEFFFLDKDECMTDNNICGFGRCENLPGSYRCVCNRGYTYDDKTKKCVGTKNSDYYFVEVTVV